MHLVIVLTHTGADYWKLSSVARAGSFIYMEWSQCKHSTFPQNLQPSVYSENLWCKKVSASVFTVYTLTSCVCVFSFGVFRKGEVAGLWSGPVHWSYSGEAGTGSLRPKQIQPGGEWQTQDGPQCSRHQTWPVSLLRKFSSVYGSPTSFKVAWVIKILALKQS